MSSLDNPMSYKGEKSYTMKFKHKAVEYDEKNSSHKAAEKFRIAVKWIGKWRQNKLKYWWQQLNQRIKGWKVVREDH